MIYGKPLSVDSCAWYPYTQERYDSLNRINRFDEAYNMATVSHALSQIGVPLSLIHI